MWLTISSIVVVLFALVAWKRFSFALALFVFAFPSYLIRFSLGPIPFTLLEALLWVLVAFWFVQKTFALRMIWKQTPWKRILVLILLSATIGIVVASDTRSAFGYWRAYFVEPILFFFLLCDVLRGQKIIRLLLLASAASATVVAGIAILQYANMLPSPAPWILEHPKRVSSLFAYPNAVGLYLGPIVGLLAGILLHARKEFSARIQFHFLGTIFLSILAILAANSRGALLAILAAAFLVGIRSVYRKEVLVASVILLALAIFMPQTRTMIRNITDRQDVSTDVRVVLWQGTANLLRARPIFGAGLGGFPQLYNQYRLIKHTELLLYPHTIILNFWVELGLLGLGAFVALFIVLYRIGVRTLRASPSDFTRGTVYAVWCALLVIVVHGLVDVPYFKNDLAMQFWLLCAFMVFASRSGTGQNTKNTV